MSVNSRVYLRGVDLVELTEKYLSGEFSNLSEPLEVKISNPRETEQILTLKEVDQLAPCETKFGGNRIFACIGHLAKDGKYVRLDPNQTEYNCMNCIRKFNTKVWGIPIHRQESDEKIYFFTIDIFCHPRCAFRALQERQHNSLYNHSYAYFSEMYNLETGENIKDLKPASDPRLLEILNGSLNWEQYHKLSKTYVSKGSNIVCLPVIEYLDQ